VITNAARAAQSGQRPYPPRGRTEPIWPAHSAVLLAVDLQLLLPKRLSAGPTWLLASLEAAVLVGPRGRLSVASRVRSRLAPAHEPRPDSAGHRSKHHLARPPRSRAARHGSPNGRELITSGALIWLTDVLIFGLWYWETDRGGPGKRAARGDGPPDLLFPQMNDDRIEPTDWRPSSSTTSTSRSPTPWRSALPTRCRADGDGGPFTRTSLHRGLLGGRQPRGLVTSAFCWARSRRRWRTVDLRAARRPGPHAAKGGPG
jgi:hypothetical protein